MSSHGFMFHPVLRIGKKIYVDYAKISPNNARDHRHVSVCGHLLRNVATIMHKAFLDVNVHAKYVLKHFVYIFTLSAIFLTFIWGSSKTIWWFLLGFSRIDVSIGRAERGASLVRVRPHLNSLNYRQMVVLKEKMCHNASHAILGFEL